MHTTLALLVAGCAVSATLLTGPAPASADTGTCVAFCDDTPAEYPFQGRPGGGAVDFGDGRSGVRYPFQGSHDRGAPAPALRQDPFGRNQ